jgi:endonuclease YncB( thermonuclease family)
VARNARGHAQLRLEAIDTLETHYKGQHQPLDLALKALDFLLKGLGIEDLQTDAHLSVVMAVQDGTPGYVLSRTTDKYRRPIAFVFAGNTPESDGSSVFLTPERLRRSMNYQLLLAGLAFPTYYNGLFHDLRETCTEAVREARVDGRGVWALDCTNTGLIIEGLKSITDHCVIMPKLFRRLIDYMDGGAVWQPGFIEWLQGRQEKVFIISKAHFTHLDTLVEVNGERIVMLEPPENLIFMD